MKRKEKAVSIPVELLEQASLDKLRKFIQKEAKRNADFACALNDWLCEEVATFPSLEEKFASRVERLFTRMEKKMGWNGKYNEYGIKWAAVTKGMGDVLDALKPELEKGNGRLVARTILKFIHTLQEKADSTIDEDDYLELSDLHEEFAEILEDSASSESWSLEEKLEVLKELRQASHYSVYREYRFYPMKSLCVDFMLTALPPEQAYIELQKLEPGAGGDLLRHRVNLLRKLGREEDLKKTILSNLRCDEIVFPEIERLRDAGRLSEARDLVNKQMWAEGRSEQSLKLLLDIVKRQDDTPAVIETLYQLALKIQQNLSYYQKLKKVVPSSDWASMYERLTGQLDQRRDEAYLASIYAAENDLDRLYQLIIQSRDNRFSFTMAYLPILPEKYHPELFQYGIAVMRDRVSKMNKSKEYAKFAKTLKKFSRLPGSTPYVTELLTHIRTTYKRRPSLLGELQDIH